MIKLLITLAVLLLWLPVGSIGGRKEEQVQFPVFLSHFYTTLNHATYSAVQNSPFLRGEFAVTEERTTVRKDRTYTGFYFYGTNTYFEFFDAGSEFS